MIEGLSVEEIEHITHFHHLLSMIIFQSHFFSYSIQFNTMPGSDSDSGFLSPLVCDQKVTIPPPLKHRHRTHRSKKQSDLNPIATAIFGSSFAVLASSGSLSAGLAGFDSVTAISSLNIASFVAVSVLSGNSVRNHIKFCDLS